MSATITKDVEIEISVVCAECGNELYVSVAWSSDFDLRAEPCEACLDDADEVGYERGKEEGYVQAEEDALEE